MIKPKPYELIAAAEAGDEAKLRQLIALGAEVDLGIGPPADTTARRRTALMAACEKAHLGCVQALLDAKASLRFVAPDGRDALARLLEARGERGAPVFRSADCDSPEILACLGAILNSGAVKDINKAVGKGFDKCSPLARATSWLDHGCMRALLSAGANPNTETIVHISWQTNAAYRIGNQGGHPLGSTLSRGDVEGCWLLFDAGADPFAKAQWQPSLDDIAERCYYVGDEGRAFLAEAKRRHGARVEAAAIAAETPQAPLASKRPRI